jgi:alpha-L-rhamnosidase
MGLMHANDWRGDWIGGRGALDPTQRPPDPRLQKRISLSEQPQRCLLQVASVGYHELRINGTQVVTGVLAPVGSNLKHRVRCVSYGIAQVPKSGANVIGLRLGISWSIFQLIRPVNDRSSHSCACRAEFPKQTPIEINSE